MKKSILLALLVFVSFATYCATATQKQYISLLSSWEYPGTILHFEITAEQPSKQKFSQTFSLKISPVGAVEQWYYIETDSKNLTIKIKHPDGRIQTYTEPHIGKDLDGFGVKYNGPSKDATIKLETAYD